MSKPSIVIDCERYHPRVLHAWADMRTSDGYEEERSYFEVAGFAALEKPDDAIPQQSAFTAAAWFFIEAVNTAATPAASVAVLEKLFEFLLKPSYALFHWRYDGWRRTMNAKCVEYSADPQATKKLRTLCRRYRRLFPEPVDEDPS